MNAEQAAQDAVKKARAKFGLAWDLLGLTIQRAFVAQEMLSIIAMNEDNSGFEKASQYAVRAFTIKL